MNRTICSLGLIGAMACLAWTQETAPTIEQLRQQWEQMQREETALLSPAWRAIGQAESRHQSGQWKRPLDKYLESVSFPMPPTLSKNLATSPIYVQVVQVSRADAQVLRHYPYSHIDYPYYEVKVRILNTWGGYTNEDPNLPIDIPFHLKAGQQIRLLWVAQRPIEGSFKMDDREWERAREAQKATQIWEVGKRYLLFGFRGVAFDMPYEERQHLPVVFPTKDEYEKWLQQHSLPPLDKVLFTVGERFFGIAYIRYVSGIAGYAQGPVPVFCSRVPYWVLPNPPKELLKLLEEESVVLRYTDEERRQWINQCLRDPNLPLWKKQRALLYLRDRDCLEQPERFLQWLMSLEPPLRAFGLQRFQLALAQKFLLGLEKTIRMPMTKEEERLWMARLFETLSQFLASEQPVEVRREAAWLFADWLTVPQRVNDWEKEAELGLAWWHQWREWLKERSQAEVDEITRLLLDASWRQIVGWEHRCQMDEVWEQLRALEQGRSK